MRALSLAVVFGFFIVNPTNLLAETPDETYFNLQAGSFQSESNAKRYQQHLLNTIDYPVTIVTQGIYQVVLVGPLDIFEAKKLKKTMEGSVIQKSDAEPQTFSLQAGSFHSMENATRYQARLSKMTEAPVSIETQGAYHVVFINPLKKAEAKALKRKIDGSVIRENPTVEHKHKSYAPVKTKKSIKSHPKRQRPFLTLSGGPAWYNTNNGSRQTFYLQPAIEKTYDGIRNNEALAVGEIFLGLQRELNNRFWGQLGISVLTSSNAHLNGDIWEDADPDFNNYIYNYKVRHTHIAMKGKLFGDYDKIVVPYLSGSIGAGINRAHDFTSTHRIFQEVSAPNFQDQTTTSLMYTVGIGVQRNFNEHLQYGVGYEFSDWGKIQLARASGQTLNSGLSLSAFYTNLLLFNISYLA